jgi:RNA-directed DNA polymerase
MTKTHQRKKRKQPQGFDKNSWKRLNDTKIYESVVWGQDDMVQDTSIVPDVEWRNIDWKKVQRHVFKLQRLIYKASSRGEHSKMRRYQKLLTKSYNARLLAVRRVTQDNTGRKTAGVDGIKNLKPKQRFNLVAMLKKSPKKPKLSLRVWIPKPVRDEKRPLGIPTIYDRALQCLHKLALEPEWEARFEPNSYGFRPGRAAQDAIGAIYMAINKKPKYVLDADIAKCFDRINHKALLDKLGLDRGKKLIKKWLNAGVIDDKQFQGTVEGTPQGGVISPLLANIALHGMEEAIKEYAANTLYKVEAYSEAKGHHKKTVQRRNDRMKGISLIRYADDFVILHENLEVLLGAKAVIEEWLQPIGLELKPSKTRITHTLWQHDKEPPGFDFLGFNVRQYHKYTERGYKTLIKPSKKAVDTHYATLKDVFDRLKTAPTKALITKLNPIIRGWCNYHRSIVAQETFSALDNLIWKRAWRWATRRHPNKNESWVKNKYFAPNGNRKWELHDKEVKLLKHADTAIERHVKVKRDKSPFDGDTPYWAARMGKHPEMPATKAKLLKKQKGRCALCGLPFGHEDLIEIDHIKPKSQGGKDCMTNYQAVHRHCHDTKTTLDAVNGCNPGTREEPGAVKVARPVLKTNG